MIIQIMFKKVKYYKTWGHSVYPNNPGFIIHLSESQFEKPNQYYETEKEDLFNVATIWSGKAIQCRPHSGTSLLSWRDIKVCVEDRAVHISVVLVHL